MAVELSRPGIIVTNIGMMLLGLLPAILLAQGIGWLWPKMGLPVFFATLLCWITGGIAVIVRDRGKREIKPVSWSEGREYTTFSRANTVLISVSALLFGFVLASLIGGFAGWLLPKARWPVFFAVLVVWGVGGFTVILRDVFGTDIRHKI
jgi:hypothetical protein